jgi:glycosyltransferase involved in cell wall biosynthesis
MKIVHVITCLNDGGAEAVLFRTIQSLPHDEHFVVSLAGLGKYGDLLKNRGVEVVDLDMTTLGRKLSAIYRLAGLIKSIAPDTIQTWMYHADFVGGIAARMAGFRNIAWGLHNSMVAASDNPLPRFALIRLNALLSHVIPKWVISCSKAALVAHRGIGYHSRKLVFIPNGYPVDAFFPDQKARMQTRADFGVVADEVLLGMVARLDPQKDHLNLLNALAILKESNTFKCLLVGKDLDQGSQLRPEIESRGLGDHVLLVGQRADIPNIMNALDVFCLSSAFSEAFPNVLCEAMACGTPCVTTDVGDSAFIVDNTGWVVPPRSPERLAAALVSAIANLPDPGRQAAARRRIVENFSVERMAEAYRSVWSEERNDPT